MYIRSPLIDLVNSTFFSYILVIQNKNYLIFHRESRKTSYLCEGIVSFINYMTFPWISELVRTILRARKLIISGYRHTYIFLLLCLLQSCDLILLIKKSNTTPKHNACVNTLYVLYIAKLHFSEINMKCL